MTEQTERRTQEERRKQNLGANHRKDWLGWHDPSPVRNSSAYRRSTPKVAQTDDDTPMCYDPASNRYHRTSEIAPKVQASNCVSQSGPNCTPNKVDNGKQ